MGHGGPSQDLSQAIGAAIKAWRRSNRGDGSLEKAFEAIRKQLRNDGATTQVQKEIVFHVGSGENALEFHLPKCNLKQLKQLKWKWMGGVAQV